MTSTLDLNTLSEPLRAVFQSVLGRLDEAQKLRQTAEAEQHRLTIEVKLLKEAIRLLRVAYQARPDPEIAAHLGEVLWNDGKTEEARKVWREGRSRDSSNDVLRETLARLRVDL